MTLPAKCARTVTPSPTRVPILCFPCEDAKRSTHATPVRGQTVTVEQTNIRPWQGTVLSVKPTKSGRYVEVQRDDGGVWVMPESKVRAS